MRTDWRMVVCVLALGLISTAGHADEVMVADFDAGTKPNNIGGDFGAWDKDANDTTQFCYDSMISEGTWAGSPFSLKLDYDVDSPNPAYNGFWSKLSGIDVTKYKYITFYVKGDRASGFTNQFKVELKNGTEVGNYLVKGITDEWKKVSIPLNKVDGITYWTSMQEFVVVFDDINASNKVGTIYLDNIAFSSEK